MQMGRFPRALELWKELATEGVRSGFVNDEFTSRLQTARALLNLGRFDESWQVLRQLAKDPRFRARELDRLNLEAGLHLEQGQAAEALRIYRQIQATAEEKKVSRWKRPIAVAICTASIHAAQPECAPLLAETGGAAAVASRDYILADFFLAQKNYTEARHRADRAYRFYAAIGNHDNALYALLVRGQAESRSRQMAELAVTRAEAEKVFGEIRREWGPAAAEQYLKRPLYQTRWSEIHRSN